MHNSKQGISIGVQADKNGTVIIYIHETGFGDGGVHFVCDPDMADEIAAGIIDEAVQARTTLEALRM